jgi:hypothetical protein
MKIRRQTTSHIMMVRPANFGYNAETAVNNAFQNENQSMSNVELSAIAIQEFDAFVHLLRANGVHVHVMQDATAPIKPDAVFPNNWITFHEDASIITYPMYAPLRRLERDLTFVDTLAIRFKIATKYHLDYFEDNNMYLEGTGSMIFDRENEIVYACISERTDADILGEFCAITGYKNIIFSAVDGKKQPIYHTNVMMALGETFVVICMDTIKDKKEKKMLLDLFEETNKEVIEISLDQMMHFAGNMLQVRNDDGETFLVMSKTAHDSLKTKQLKTIAKHTKVLYPDITNIETIGGGSARCMMAEIFLPTK